MLNIVEGLERFLIGSLPPLAPVPAQRAGRVGELKPAEDLVDKVAEGRFVAAPRDGALPGSQRPVHREERNELQSCVVARPAAGDAVAVAAVAHRGF